MSAAPMFGADRVPRLLDQLLAEQRSLSAVDVFARRHDEGEHLVAARVYEERIPVGRTPLPGQQLAFRVDLDSCTGCKACVTACHSLNGLAPEETWRDVGLLLGVGESAGVQQTVTTACHHCEDPACLSGCPVRAYEKDPVTGIVRHLDDQCIGCQYCVLKCPYEVPKYNAALGIVRKCDMCSSRLAVGEAPACVQGCPNGAISIEIVDAVGPGGGRELLPAAAAAEIPDSAHTRPTTRYVSRKPIGPLQAANRDRLHPAHAHDPLAVMLVLMQLSVGTLAFAALAGALGVASAFARSAALALAAVCAMTGLGAATLHLGRPLYAFRAVLGWRTSWMSREILVFGAYVPLVALGAAASSIALVPGVSAPLVDLAETLLPALRGAALAFGVAGTVCSIMIYVDTRRRAWALSRTAPTFAGTALGLGALGANAVLALVAWIERDSGVALPALWLAIGVVVLGLKIAAERRLSSRRDAGDSDALSRTARLLSGPLRVRQQARFAAAGAGVLASAAGVVCGIAAAPGFAAGFAWAGLACFVLGELVERHLYFTSEASPAMPGH
ncbi:MAG: molybdopterin oxidoreductase [Deltaproteobacteria bacterium]|nr:MAG: molybdopterin oxidoreductase [Deltaproteobacteria bacterium]